MAATERLAVCSATYLYEKHSLDPLVRLLLPASYTPSEGV